MGIDMGVLAASAPWEPFFSALSATTGDFIPKGRTTNPAEIDLSPNDDGFPLLAGDHNGRSYVVDSSTMLTAGDYDRLLGLSASLSCRVAAVLGESVSGTCSLFVAEAGTLSRLYYHCSSTLSRPFEQGQPLRSESAVSADEIEGRGLFAALSDLGFEFEHWESHVPKQILLYTARDEEQLAKRTIAEAVNAHRKAYGLPPLVPSVVIREQTLADGSSGFYVAPVVRRIAHLQGLKYRRWVPRRSRPRN